jgi:hypothetical protein
LEGAMLPQRNASPAEIAQGSGARYRQDGREAVNAMTQTEKTWEEQEIKPSENGNQDGNAGNDQNTQARGRSLPDEQRSKGRGRSR